MVRQMVQEHMKMLKERILVNGKMIKGMVKDNNNSKLERIKNILEVL